MKTHINASVEPQGIIGIDDCEPLETGMRIAASVYHYVVGLHMCVDMLQKKSAARLYMLESSGPVA
jgi:hypothetical protein